ncbi:MAG: nuclease, partial [Cyanobacteriota bacterium]|nr:nuclease [Cyanobacteriota bacterium]
DHNRTYTVRLACLQVDPSDEAEAMAWLKSELPRRRRVNLRPEGSSEGVLLARVTSIGSDVDLRAGLAAAGLGRLTCDSPQA